MINEKRQIIVSGIMPTGDIHIGNYLGAIYHWVRMQDRYKIYIMIADLHAITTPQKPAALHQKTIEVAKLLLACGIDPKKTVLFVQSHVPAHTELAWILNTITPLGELERMTQFKEKKEKTGILAGLLNYPVLQAADILIYKAQWVPVGEDQLQHLELTRAIAQKFNAHFDKLFPIPDILGQKILFDETSKIMGLDDPTKKMSKSASSPNNYIGLLDSPDEIRRKIKIAVTDSDNKIHFDRQNKPAISNLMTIYGGFSTLELGTKPYPRIQRKFDGKNYSQFKNEIAEYLIKKLSPIQKKYIELRTKSVLTHLKKGSKNANTLANKTLLEVKRSVGFVL